MNIPQAVQVHGAWTFTWADADGRERRREEHNLIVNTGLYALASIISGELEQTCAVWLAMGTGTTAAAATDIALETESIRKVITTRTRSGAAVVYRFYFLASEAVGDYYEWGVFLEATALSGSGRLLNRLVPAGGVSKDATENLTVEVRLTMTAA